ncbi:MAG: choice-of-anchor tandem repeat GloVer-containing protein [Rhizomicrobium sp.]|jgi:uncharacterized repeat protein (TIGR03803 family)
MSAAFKHATRLAQCSFALVLSVAMFGGAANAGEKTLYSFAGGSADGAEPWGTLVADASGNLYGTTHVGGTGTQCGTGGCGTVFEIAPNGMETILYNFAGGCDGAWPWAGVTLDKSSAIYGTTTAGGSCDGKGHGAVFKLAPDGTETVLYSFQSASDASIPYGNLVMDKSGNLYGTTLGGGTAGYGTVFKLAASGSETILHSFSRGTSDGFQPWAGLVMDKSGNLYGTTVYGGSNCDDPGCGTVFKLAPDGTETILHSFEGSDGELPYAGLLLGEKKMLYGTTVLGGANSEGVVFSLKTK